MTTNPDIETLARQWIDSVIAGSPVGKALGVEIRSAEVDRVRIRLPYDDDLTTVPETLHGGVVATLVDITGAAASATGVRADHGATGGATSHLSITFLAPARSDLEATGTVLHRTRSTTQTDVLVRDPDGQLVAAGQVTSRIFHRGGTDPAADPG